MIRLHFYGFIAGFILDLIIGDPHWFKIHPVRIMGWLISTLDRAFLGPKDTGSHKSEGDGRLDIREYIEGLFTIALTTIFSILLTALILFICYRVSHILFIAAEAFLTCTCLSGASLIRETSPVKRALKQKNINEARKRLSYVVGRDTDSLSPEEIEIAVIETLAENMCDGIISPVFYLALLGPCGGMAFKAISTGDSMIGYKSRRYYSFGRTAARMDDILNYIPARITAFLIIFVSIFNKKLSAKKSASVYISDHDKTESPNAGCPESAMAGSLGIQLGGAAYYGGELIDRPLLGTPGADDEDYSLISLAQRIVVSGYVVMEIICAFVLYLV